MSDSFYNSFGSFKFPGPIQFASIKTATSASVPNNAVYVGVTDTSAVRTITLPALSALNVGRMIVVKDETGAASGNPIVVAGNGSDPIDGALTISISTDYGSVMLFAEGTTWSVVGGGSGGGSGITELTGDVLAGPGTGSQTATLVNASVTGQPLTGFVAGAGTVVDTDTILEAIQKLAGNSSDPALGWKSYTITYTDVQSAAGGGNFAEVPIGPYLAGGFIVEGVIFLQNALFTGGGLTAVTARAGIEGDTTLFTTGFDVYNGNDPMLTSLQYFNNGLQPAVGFQGDASFNDLTQGELVVLIKVALLG